jgi:hypothetical protein
MIADPLTKLLSQEVFGKHVNTMGVRIFELSFWTSGRCWNYMCPATIFKVIWNYLIFGIPHYGNIHVFIHEISLHIYYGIIACWNILKC